MPVRPFKLNEETVVLPRGTRVVLKTDVRGEDGYLHKTASVAVVREVSYNTYTLETPSGRTLSAQRDQIATQREDLLADLGQRQWDFRLLREQVIYAAVVGSHAWGLAEADSDRDVRGCFVAPFEDHAGLWDLPGEIQDESSDAAYWEIEKLVLQGLRGDANTLETLWSPLHEVVTPLGQMLLDRREMFVSMNILGSFGRYAQSQLKKIERSLERDAAVTELLEVIERGELDSAEAAADLLFERQVAPRRGAATKDVHAVARSLFDRGLLESANFDALVSAVHAGRRAELQPAPHRPKNAYNLLRLLHSCVAWLTHGEPLIEVAGPLRHTLLAIKRRETPIERVLELARELTTEIDDAAEGAGLPERPDYEAADELLRTCRRHAARVSLLSAGLVDERDDATIPGPMAADDPYAATLFPTALPPDVDPTPLREFLGRYLDADSPKRLHLAWLALTGAHAYGFPSPDSDLDLKGTHVVPATVLLGLSEPKQAIDFLDDFRGREYDFTSNELGQTARLALRGNGNVLERFLGPLPLITTRAGHELRGLIEANISRRVVGHYRGFFSGMRREYDIERRKDKRRAKRLLYAYRVALTGIHLLREGEVVTDVRTLADRYRFPRVSELIAIKQRAEKQTLDGDDRPYLEDFHRLERDLQSALEASTLPEEPAAGTELERFVIEQRLQAET